MRAAVFAMEQAGKSGDVEAAAAGFEDP